MARENWCYPNIPDDLGKQVDAAMRILKERGVHRYKSRNHFIICAIEDLLSKEGLTKAALEVKA